MAKGTKAGVHHQWYWLLRVFAYSVPAAKTQSYNYRYILRGVFK